MMGAPKTPKPGAPKPPPERPAARTAAGTDQRNTHQDPPPLLLLVDYPMTQDDQFILVRPNGDQTFLRPEWMYVLVDVDLGTTGEVVHPKVHVIPVTGIPEHPAETDLYALVHKRAGKALHILFKALPGTKLTREKGGAPSHWFEYRKRFYNPLVRGDKDLDAPRADYRKVVPHDPKFS